jgi:alpha-N-arabinofuranosidase
VAGVHFNIFHNHSDRVQMANIAQMVNVIQAMILTKQNKMILTPTYHVFEMYKVHQDAERVALDLNVDTVEENGYIYPQVSASASKAENGTLNISLCNLDKVKDTRLNLDLRGIELSDVSGRILTANELNARNTFEEPENVAPIEFTGFNTEGNKLTIDLPSKSVVVLSVK